MTTKVRIASSLARAAARAIISSRPTAGLVHLRPSFAKCCQPATATCSGYRNGLPGSLDNGADHRHGDVRPSRTMWTLTGYGLVRLDGASAGGSRRR